MIKKATETLSRQWAILKRMPRYPNWISTKELHIYLTKRGFNVDLRTVQRDLDHLSVEFPVYSEKRGGHNFWQWAKGAHSLTIPDSLILDGQAPIFAQTDANDQMSLVVRMKADEAHHMYESKLADDPVINNAGADSVKVSATVSNSNETRRWLLGFGDQLEVLHPESLRDEFAVISRNMNTIYK